MNTVRVVKYNFGTNKYWIDRKIDIRIDRYTYGWLSIFLVRANNPLSIELDMIL